jgi:DNA-binding winged helix-turn-helix (wHTH) protein
MGLEINTLYRFEGFEMDPANRVFGLGGKPIAIPSRAFDLLLYMACNTQRLLTKEELMKAVWGNTIVEEGNLTQSVFLLRKALSANPATGNKLIVTVPGSLISYKMSLEGSRVSHRRMSLEEVGTVMPGVDRQHRFAPSSRLILG